jgi:hypothetical protein
MGLGVGRRLEAVLLAALAADLHLAVDVHTERVGELKSVEEGEGDDGGALVGGAHLLEAADHLGTQHAAALVRQLDHVAAAAVAGRARLDPHVELACNCTHAPSLVTRMDAGRGTHDRFMQTAHTKSLVK